jgi:hypothetical protein
VAACSLEFAALPAIAPRLPIVLAPTLRSKSVPTHCDWPIVTEEIAVALPWLSADAARRPDATPADTRVDDTLNRVAFNSPKVTHHSVGSATRSLDGREQDHAHRN